MDDLSHEFLFGRIDYERKSAKRSGQDSFRLETMRSLMARLGDPQVEYPVIHIAGTKGKGSTATMVGEILRSAGYRTGLYTSPHLDRLEERFQIDGREIQAERLDRLITEIRPLVEEFDAQAARQSEALRPPTFFEITTALAFLAFRQARVDVAVIEVGLGGRLDSTNVCQPTACAITNIGLDHTHLLGRELSQIAAEKAGIIKPGVPVISGESNTEAAVVIRRIADEQGSPLFEAERDFGAQDLGGDANRFDYWTDRADDHSRLRGLELGVFGRHQQKNAAVALAICGTLRASGWNIPDEAMRHGLRDVKLPGRIEKSASDPRLILDVAHNVPSIQAFLATINERFNHGHRTLVLAISRDKDLAGMLSCIPEHFDRVVLTQYLENPRAASPQELERLLKQQLDQTPASRLKREQVSIAESPAEAFRAVEAGRTPDGWVFVAGSVFLASEYGRCVQDPKHEPAV